MKRRILSLSIVLALLIGAGMAGPTVLAQDDVPVLGAINIIQPEVYVLEVGADEETRLSGPSVFESGETMRTDETGVALITWFYEGTESVLGQNSTLKLNTFSGGVAQAFVIDLELVSGHFFGGLGTVASENAEGTWTLKTPAYSLRLLRGQFEVTVNEDGSTLVVVTEGRVELTVEEGGEPVVVDANQFVTSAADGTLGTPETLSDDGVTVNLEGVCTASAGTNINVRLAPSENSRRLGGVSAGQVFWVRSSTEGDLWLQVYYQTAPDDEEGHNYGWVYGPAVTLDEEACAVILRAPLDAKLFGGPGVGRID